jgi:hypothetical protein
MSRDIPSLCMRICDELQKGLKKTVRGWCSHAWNDDDAHEGEFVFMFRHRTTRKEINYVKSAIEQLGCAVEIVEENHAHGVRQGVDLQIEQGTKKRPRGRSRDEARPSFERRKRDRSTSRIPTKQYVDAPP